MRISGWSSDVCSSDLPRHQLGIDPASPDFRIEPLAERRVGQPAEHGDRGYGAEPDVRPTPISSDQEGTEQRGARDQQITARAMQDRAEDLPRRDRKSTRLNSSP